MRIPPARAVAAGLIGAAVLALIGTAAAALSSRTSTESSSANRSSALGRGGLSAEASPNSGLPSASTMSAPTSTTTTSASGLSTTTSVPTTTAKSTDSGTTTTTSIAQSSTGGATTTTTVPAGTVQVPDLTGATWSVAVVSLQNDGLNPTSDDSVCVATPGGPEPVVATIPRAGVSVSPGATVYICN